jgi:hypothetical protein
VSHINDRPTSVGGCFPKVTVNPLNNEFLLKNINFSLHLTGNTLRLRYRDQPVNDAFGETVAVYCEKHMEHINTPHGQSFGMLKLLVNTLTTGF